MLLLESGSVGLVDKVHHNLYHYILFLCFALGNHESEGNECVVSNSFGAIGAIEDGIVVHKS